jgi:hypothetical protein
MADTPKPVLAVTDWAAELQNRMINSYNTLTAAEPVKEAVPPEVWVSIISAVLNAFVECRKAKAEKAAMAGAIRNPTVIHQLKLRKHLRQQLVQDVEGGAKMFRRRGQQFIQAALQTGLAASENDANAFVDTVVMTH